MKRNSLFAAVALALGVLVAGQPAAAEDITLEFTVWNYSLDTIQDNARKFEAENPGIKVKITDYTWQDYHDSLVLRLRSGTPTDIAIRRPGLAAGLGRRRVLRAARRHRAGRCARRPQVGHGAVLDRAT